MLSPQVERQQLTVDKKLATSLSPVQAAKERIGQVIIHLVHNAIKFTKPGGKITVATQMHGRESGRHATPQFGCPH